MNNNIIETLTRIETKLDEVIAALHAYDGDEWDEPNDALKEAAEQYNKLVAPCRGHDAASWDEEEANKRMDIIGQNGNEGSHYVTNEEADEDAFNDYGMRVVNGDSDKGTQDKNKRTGGNKKKYKGKRKFTQDLIPKNK
jgi:arabinogalactan endo-1,4-beta-galactosidase